VGLLFLLPNILGFLSFIFIPLALSLMLAFSNWDLRLHNMFRDEPLSFVGLSNFTRLLGAPEFWRYLGNTLFLMMAIPFGIAGSLLAAILLSQDLGGGARRTWVFMLLGAVFVSGVGMLVMLGMGVAAMTLLMGVCVCLILMGGVAGGSTIYRTLFYMPHFTAGVATYILWKKLYSPHTGPINAVLRPCLDGIGHAVNATPPGLVQTGMWVALILMIGLLVFGLSRLQRWWRYGDLGWIGLVIGLLILSLPAAVGYRWLPVPVAGIGLLVLVAVILLWLIARVLWADRLFKAPTGEGLGGTLIFTTVLMVGQFVLLIFGAVMYNLPAMSLDGGLEPPNWLSDPSWAKPALMMMALWAAIGSNNMLLYLAGLSNVPGELYEAASIDGAGRFAKFWHVTWPQLAPITFFIVVMSMIYGLQGGFEMARTMTQGGPAGATTTLSYYVYTEGFETGRLGYAAAITWTLFALVLVITMFNWKFGNRFVND
jgi:multiple sugar transport system permease protein